MGEPFFSIIIPTYNEEKYISRLLNDLVHQNERDFEVIVVDGKSTDKTKTKVGAYVEKLPLTFVTIQGEKGNVSLQRNDGAQKARGTYLVFFDADVQIPPNFLKSLRGGIEKNKSLFVTTNLVADSDLVYDEAIARFQNLLFEALVTVERQFAPGFNFIVLKDVFKRIGGFREDIKHAEDYDLSERLQKAGCKLTVFKQPQLVFSLRRYRQEGRLSVLRKNAAAGIHLLTKGPITKDIFFYPMGGGWYGKRKKTGLTVEQFHKAEKYIKKFIKLIIE